MDPLIVVVLKVVGTVSVFALLWYGGYRAVSAAKKRGRAGLGGQILGTVLMLFSGTALDPAREVAAEQRKLKRNQDGSGDPDSDTDTDEAR
jgi:hypothetical protein